jgi:hypothetical protein
MDWLSLLSNSGLSGVLGGLTGLVGGAISKHQELKRMRLEFAHEENLANLTLQEMEHEQNHELKMASKQTERASLEGQIAIGSVEAEAFASSVDKAFSPVGDHWVDAVKGLMRPVITLFLLIVTAWLTAEIWGAVGGLGALTEKELTSLFQYVVKQIVFLAVLSTSWWFAARPSNMQHIK